MRLVSESLFDMRLAVKDGLLDGGLIDHQIEGEKQTQDDDCRQKVAPDVDALVVHHEKAAENLARGIEVDTIAMSNVVVILHVAWGNLVVSDKVSLSVSRPFSCRWSRLSLTH